jgi:transposase
MANKLLQMTMIKQILRRLEQGESQNKIAKELQVHKRSVRSYKELFTSAGLNIAQALLLSDDELTALIHSYKPRATTHTGKRYAVLQAQFSYYCTELKRTGVTLQLLWEEYKQKHPEGYEYSQFAYYVSRYRSRDQLSMRLDHDPGLVLQLDFAGDKLSYVDTDSGELVSCEVLVCSLPFSGYSLALALPSQKQGDFVSGINWMLRKLGVLPKVLKMDNLKSGVIKAERYEPDFNELLLQLADHYGLVLKTARVRKPKDKPSVENAVCQVYRQAYAPLRNESFLSLKELNMALVQKMDVFNRKNFQGREYSRYDSLQEEVKQMTPLEGTPFELIQQSSAKVQNDYHVLLGVDKHKYSVPHAYYRQQVSIQFTDTLVRIYNSKNECIATHERVRSPHKHSTKYEHMPENHQAYSDQLQWSGTYYVQQAEQIGKHTKTYILKLLKSKNYEQLSYDSCKGLLSLRKTYSHQHIEQACERFSEVEVYSYKPVKNLLEKWEKESAGAGASLSPSASSTQTPQQHNNLRK